MLFSTFLEITSWLEIVTPIVAHLGTTILSQTFCSPSKYIIYNLIMLIISSTVSESRLASRNNVAETKRPK